MVSVIVYNRNGTKELEFESRELETVGDVKKMLDSDSTEELQLAFQNEILKDSTVLASLGEEIELMVEGSIELTAIDQTGIDQTGIELTDIELTAIDQAEIDQANIYQTGIDPAYIDQADEMLFTSEDPYEGLIEQATEGIMKQAPCSDLVNRITFGNSIPAIEGESAPGAASNKFPDRTSDYFTLNGKTYRITERRKRLTFKNVLEKLEAFFTPALLFQCLMLLFILHTNNIFVLVVLIGIRSMRILSSFIQRQKLWEHVNGHASKSIFMLFASLLLLDHTSFYASSSGMAQDSALD